MAPFIPLPSEGATGETSDHKATATCFCGSVQILFPTEEPGFVDSFVCNCHDCRKITASVFASNFIVLASHTEHIRGQEKLSKYSQSHTIATGNTMENHFCSNCGTLMYRVSSGFPGCLIARIGTIDDFSLQEGKLKPRVEQFTKDRVAWFKGAEGVPQVEGSHYGAGPGAASSEKKSTNL